MPGFQKRSDPEFKKRLDPDPVCIARFKIPLRSTVCTCFCLHFVHIQGAESSKWEKCDYGVDPNRNFPIAFDHLGPQSYPCDDRYNFAHFQVPFCEFFTGLIELR